MTLLSLCSLNHGDDDLACDKVMTSKHGSLLARRGRSTVTSDQCLGELRLHDPVTNKVFCLDKEGEENEFLECEERSTTQPEITTTSASSPKTSISTLKPTTTFKATFRTVTSGY